MSYQYGNGYNQSFNNPPNYPSLNQQPYAFEELSQYRTNQNDNIYNEQNQYSSNKQYLEEGGLYANSRSGFIRKVYTLLSLQLCLTTLICLWAMKSESFKNTFVNTPCIIILSVLLIVVSILIGCCSETFRKYALPILIVFTLIFGLLVGIVCSSTKPDVVVAAAGITSIVVIGLTIFACVTKTDLTGCGPYLFVFLLVMAVFGIVCIFWKNAIVQLIYACLAVLLYSMYLIFDTQMVLGKFENAYSLDDAYFAAIQLYIDIIQIFLQVLRILSYVNN